MIYNIAAIMKIPVEQIRITTLLPGSTIISIQVLQSNPLAGEENQSADLNNSYIPNLSTFADGLVKSLNSGEIKTGYNILDLTYKVSNTADMGKPKVYAVPSVSQTTTQTQTTTTVVTPTSTTTTSSTSTSTTTTQSGAVDSTTAGIQTGGKTTSGVSTPDDSEPLIITNPDGTTEMSTKLKIIIIVVSLLVFIGVLIGVIISCLNAAKGKEAENTGEVEIPDTPRTDRKPTDDFNRKETNADFAPQGTLRLGGQEEEEADTGPRRVDSNTKLTSKDLSEKPSQSQSINQSVEEIQEAAPRIFDTRPLSGKSSGQSEYAYHRPTNSIATSERIEIIRYKMNNYITESKFNLFNFLDDDFSSKGDISSSKGDNISAKDDISSKTFREYDEKQQKIENEKADILKISSKPSKP